MISKGGLWQCYLVMMIWFVWLRLMHAIREYFNMFLCTETSRLYNIVLYILHFAPRNKDLFL